MYLLLGTFPSVASVNCVLKVIPSSPVPRSYAIRIIQTGFRHLKKVKNCLFTKQHARFFNVTGHLGRAHEQFPLVDGVLLAEHVHDNRPGGHIGDQICEVQLAVFIRVKFGHLFRGELEPTGLKNLETFFPHSTLDLLPVH